MKKKRHILKGKFIWIYVLIDIYVFGLHSIYLIFVIAPLFSVWEYPSPTGTCVIQELVNSSPASST